MQKLYRRISTRPKNIHSSSHIYNNPLLHARQLHLMQISLVRAMQVAGDANAN